MNWVAPIKDQETLKNFGETLKQVDYKYYIMFELGVGTGLQLQDILAFKNKDVTGKKEIEVTIGTRNMMFHTFIRSLQFLKNYSRLLMSILRVKILKHILFLDIVHQTNLYQENRLTEYLEVQDTRLV